MRLALIPALLLGAASLAVAQGGSSPSAASGASGAAAAAAPARPAGATGAAAAAAARQAKPGAPRKVWTATDLAKLRAADGGVTMLESVSIPEAAPLPQGTTGPEGVPARLQEMVSEARTKLGALERERLAASNPLLRGLAGGQAIRPVSEIDKDRAKWSERLRMAENALENASK